MSFNELYNSKYLNIKTKIIKNSKTTYLYSKWRPPSLNELTPIIFSMGLTHLGSEAAKYYSPLRFSTISRCFYIFKYLL